MNDLQTAVGLRAAAAYLRAYGWRQGSFGVDGGPRCLVGALAVVNATEDAERCMGFTFDSTVDETWPSFWNDRSGRTLDEVLDRLESTALALEVRFLSHETQALLEVVVTTPELVGV